MPTPRLRRSLWPNPSNCGGGRANSSPRALLPGRAILDRQALHVHDLATEVETEFPEDKTITSNASALEPSLSRRCFGKAFRSVPIVIRRTEVRPFTEKQIALLKTFADQAVIAIENVRLFKDSRSATQIGEA